MCDPSKSPRHESNPDCATAMFGDVPSPYCNMQTTRCTHTQCAHDMHCEDELVCIAQQCTEMVKPRPIDAARANPVEFLSVLASTPISLHTMGIIVIVIVILFGLGLAMEHGLPM